MSSNNSEETTSNSQNEGNQGIKSIEEINKINEARNQETNKLLLFNTFYYVFVFVVIGLPIWVLTTTTYRASLPFDDIDQLSTSSLQNGLLFQINIRLSHFNAHISSAQLADLEKRLSSELNKQETSNTIDSLKFHYQIKSSKIDKKDADVSKNSNSIADLRKVADYFKTDFLGVETIKENFKAKINNERRPSSKKDLNVVNFDQEYEITFSLIDEKPDKNFNTDDWKIETYIQGYFQRILSHLTPYIEFQIKTQILLYSDFASYPRSHKKLDNESYFYIQPTDLSIMTNNIESRLGSRITDSSALEFVTYVPSSKPLFIVSGQYKVNSFLVPKWGGIYINNSPKITPTEISESVKVFLTQFIDLVGISLNKNDKHVQRSGIYRSELYGYLLRKTLENQVNSISTLKSLSLLLTRISSMVIEDDIADQIKKSTESVKDSLIHAGQGDIDQAFRKSKTAFISSEKAFFDQSLLEKLYFPEDQRFAIYIPLFIPVGIPVLLSLKVIINAIKNRKQKTD